MNTDPREVYKKILVKLIPEASVETIAEWILRYNFNLKITRSRASKFGDYTPPSKRSRHLITINHDLNPYNFLITLVHEVAHLVTHEKHLTRIHQVKPHGIEWKNEFQHLIQPFMHRDIFPEEVLTVLHKYMRNPAASSCSDISLLRVLRKYDKEPSRLLHLEELPAGSIFKAGSERMFTKGKKHRVRFECTEMHTQRKYLFHPLAEVEPVYRTLFE